MALGGLSAALCGTSKYALFAGGPSREYQFLRNQLRRDKDVIVDVLLQSGSEGISQDAREILELEPANRTAMAWLKHRGQSPLAH